MNPGEARAIGKDVDDVLIESESTIDLLYQEYAQEQRDLITFGDILDNMQRNDQTIPNELKVNIRNAKARLSELDRRIVHYENLMLGRIRDRLSIVKDSPGASVHRSEIKEVERGIFRLEKKMKDKGSDARPDIQRLMTALVNLEHGAGVFLSPPVQVEHPKSKRKADERELYAGLVDEWGRVFRHAKNDPRVQDDIEWVNAQIRSLSDRFERGESIRLGMERVARRIKDIHNRTKPRAKLQDFDSASQGIQDFADGIKEYAKGGVTPSGIDKLQFELEEFSRQFSPQAKAEWTKDEQRKFGGAIRKLRKALDGLRRRRKENPTKASGKLPNPCVGFHFHGKDADELLEALEKSSKRMSAGVVEVRENPKKRRRPKETAAEFRNRIAQQAPRVMDEFGPQVHRMTARLERKGVEAPGVAFKMAVAHYVDKLDNKKEEVRENPKKKTAKKTARKAATPEWERLIGRCQKLWSQYLEHPSKKALKDVLSHLEKMEKSTSEKVKKERARCLRVASQEAKRLDV